MDDSGEDTGTGRKKPEMKKRRHSVVVGAGESQLNVAKMFHNDANEMALSPSRSDERFKSFRNEEENDSREKAKAGSRLSFNECRTPRRASVDQTGKHGLNVLEAARLSKLGSSAECLGDESTTSVGENKGERKRKTVELTDMYMLTPVKKRIKGIGRFVQHSIHNHGTTPRSNRMTVPSEAVKMDGGDGEVDDDIFDYVDGSTLEQKRFTDPEVG